MILNYLEYMHGALYMRKLSNHLILNKSIVNISSDNDSKGLLNVLLFLEQR